MIWSEIIFHDDDLFEVAEDGEITADTWNDNEKGLFDTLGTYKPIFLRDDFKVDWRISRNSYQWKLVQTHY